MWLCVLKFVSLIALTRGLSGGSNCSAAWFDCGDGKCISQIWICDGDNDCGNLMDEQNCDNPMESKCLSSQFQCESHEHCIPEKWHCDGDKDCDDGSDEQRCDNITEACTGFTCRDHHCIPLKWHCDGNADCEDGSDEEMCNTGKLCADSDFLCSSGSCINQTLVCDGKKDCADGSDEGSHCGDPCQNATCSQNCRSTPSGPQCFCDEGYELDAKDNKTCLDINECLEDGFCSHQCTNTPGAYRCSCQSGYELVNRTCQATGADPFLVFSTIQEIRGMRLRSNKYFLVRRATDKATAVDVDPKSERMYWIEVGKRSSIYSARTDGSDMNTILSHGLQIPEDIAVDYIANNLYLTDSGLKQVLVCKMDGTMCHVLHDKNIERPRSLVLDLTEGFLYWSDWGEHSSGIYRSGMDGSRRIPFVSTRIAWPNGIAIDHTTNRLYWADARLNSIEYISLDGNSRKVIFNGTVFHPYSLAIFEDTIYWTDWNSFSLEACNKFTGHKMKVMARENGRHIMGVHVYHPVLTAKVPNPCWSNDCSHMCLISPGSSFRCACPHGFELGKDGKTCRMTEYSEVIFVSEGSRIFLMRLGAVGSQAITELNLHLNTPFVSKVAFDNNLHFLFVADMNTPAIYAVNMTSLHMLLLVRNHIETPEDLSFDWRSNNLYWIDSSKGTLEVISVDSFRRTVILENLQAPLALAISPANGRMFVATIAMVPSVNMYDMDGKNKRTLHSVQGVPMSIAVHPTKTLLYWADPKAGTISYVNYTTSRNARILVSKIEDVMSVAASEDFVYWTSSQRELHMLKGNFTHILRLPGQENELVTRKVTYGLGRTIAARSGCLIGNGGCSYMCLTSPKGRSCACPPEMVLAEDNRTCIARPCEPSDFKCMDGQCLPQDMRCDNIKDCKDGSDEAGCNRCSGDDFQCKNGKCILKSWQCDHRNDCEDNSDEENCPIAATCLPDQVVCLNGECVSVLWRCDGEPDCEDGTDEKNCSAARCDLGSHFRCDNGQCVPVSWVCDRSEDCLDKSDERNCSKKTCTIHEFQCQANGNCIDERLRCDGRKDCNDGSDEENCPAVHKACKKGMFECKDGACFYDYEVCDGHGDCKNEEDELNCTHTSCQPEEHFCASQKKCILPQWICDGDEDCADGSDEDNCGQEKSTTQPTPLAIDPDCKEFYCFSSNQCIPWSKVCDGRQDCRELPDEGGLCSRACSRNGGCSHICRKTPHGSRCECHEGYRLLPDNKTCSDVDECAELGSCSHFCNNTRGGFKCSCADGYFLHDHRHCKADGGPAKLVYFLGDQIRSYNLGDNSTNVYIDLKNADMRGLDYDASEDIYFWTEYDGTINSYSLYDNRQDVILKSSSRPIYVRYDWITKNLYYRDDNSSIVACTIQGKYCTTLVHTTVGRIDSMDISPATGYMFWTIWANTRPDNRPGLIERAEMDGLHKGTLISDKLISPTGITIDHVLKKIYWVDFKLNTLECSDFHGLQRRLVVKSNIYLPHAAAVFEDNVYWADWGTDSVIRCNKFTGENCIKIIDGNVKTRILLVVHKVKQQDGVNKCLNINCSELCLPTRNGFHCTYESTTKTPTVVPIEPLTVVPKSVVECPKDHCHGGGECVVQNNEFICKCALSYSGKECEVKSASSHSNDNNSWVIAVIFAVVLAGVIVLGILLCIRNREKIQRMSENVSIKFRSPKSGQDGRLVMDTDDGSLCEELVLGSEGDFKQIHGNSDYGLEDSGESDLKKWPSLGRDSALLNNTVNFFRKMKLNAPSL